jgi:hypothetical protein
VPRLSAAEGAKRNRLRRRRQHAQVGKAKRHSSYTGTANPMAFGVGMYDACRREIGDSAANPTSAIATVSVAMYVVHSAATPRAAF